jgi:hypothetical protein
MVNPREKDPISPISPIPAGMAPPPKREATGRVREMATFLILGEPTLERAAKPTGKKEVASIA